MIRNRNGDDEPMKRIAILLCLIPVSYTHLKTADRIDDLLEERLDYAFDERLGYLTSCPTNVGTVSYTHLDVYKRQSR